MPETIHLKRAKSIKSTAENGIAAEHIASPVERARQLYDKELRAKLEPGQNGSYVAIHPDSGHYSVARGQSNAYNIVRGIYPVGPIIVRHIGPAPENLRQRIRGERPA